MNTYRNPKRPAQRGYALMLVLILTALGVLLLGSALEWTSTNAVVVARSNQYYTSVAAAEAATEMVLARMARDYQIDGEARIAARMATYRMAAPTPADGPYWADFEFSNGQDADQTYVFRTATATYTNLEGQYRGLYGNQSTYRVVSNARNVSDQYDITAAVEQGIGLASIPLFQFAIFYNLDLEINPGPDMDVTGPVHGNNNIYMDPQSTLTFWSGVASAMDILEYKKPGDPLNRANGTVVYKDPGAPDSHVSSLNLPIGTNNTPDAVRAVIEIPPPTEDRFSAMGTNRYYNKADLIILVSNNTVMARSGPNHSAVVLGTNDWRAFVRTNVSFFNKRENKTIQTTQVDVGALRQWSTTNTTLRPVIGGDVSILYVADLRSTTSSTEPGVRLVNGQYLPNEGLTVATPDPIYVQGHYNAPDTTVGSTNTSATKPASLVGDAITILSGNWNDANSTLGLSSRVAKDTTVNAAFLAGIVQTTGSSNSPGVYSGGVENFPRFLEKWGSGRTITYNGSMVVMFESKIARAIWGTGDVYDPPRRRWAFDNNFRDPTKRPPGTPEVRALVRRNWAMIKPGDPGALSDP